jgi:hypothetical protein
MAILVILHEFGTQKFLFSKNDPTRGNFTQRIDCACPKRGNAFQTLIQFLGQKIDIFLFLVKKSFLLQKSLKMVIFSKKRKHLV